MSISQYIKNDLQARLTTGQALPPRMTLEGVAALYQVSTTPVRTAVDELVAEGFLRRGNGRRLCVVNRMESHANGNSNPAVNLPRAPRDLLDVISNDLVRLSLEGRPIHMREEATAEKYQASRSAIRNIFHRLAGSGLLEHVPRRGWVLRPFRQEDMQAFLEIREVLEIKALKLAEPFLQEVELQRLLDGNQLPKSDNEPPLIDNSLHAYIIDRAGNPYIKQFFVRKGRYYEILFDWEDLDREAAIETARQHREILEAILHRDWRSARKSLSWHIRCNHPVISKIVSRQNHRLNGSP